ncbi:MAG: hypothetical protein U9N33_05670 [Campylobacterota bacterium]|nr:hypothetical protein [Campylobacterota bacterium]
MESSRYKYLKPLLNQTSVFECIFSKYGHLPGSYDVKTTCLTFIKPKCFDDLVIDHMWMASKVLQSAKLRTGQTILIQAKLITRTRPSKDLFGEMIKDVKFKNVEIIDKGRTKNGR